MSAPKVPKRAALEGAAILQEVHAALGRYVVFSSPDEHDAVTLYIAATHAQPAWEHATRLAILSPEKRCGKSRLLDMIECLGHNPMITVNISIPALVRSIPPADPPTVLVDEADAIFGKRVADTNEELRGILNAGHQRNRPYTRWDVTTRSAEEYPCFAMAVLAAIGELPDTIMDRSIKIRMRRRALDEKVSPYRQRRDGMPLRQLGDRLHVWVRDHLEELQKAEPEMPVEDREADNWEPLFALAELAGDDWRKRAHQACLALTSADQESRQVSHVLLADLQRIWRPREESLFTTTIIDRLAGLDESRWLEFGRSHRLIDSRGVAELLKPYGVKPQTVRQPGEPNRTARGYRRGDLVDPWKRYCNDTDNTDNTGESDELF
jgi:Protein of unknown function (DUF3631)